MAWQITVESALGEHGPLLLPDDYDQMTALDVLAKTVANMAEEVGNLNTRGLGFRAPLTVRVEEIERL